MALTLVYSKIDYTKKSGHEQGITSQLNKKQEFGRGGDGQINYFLDLGQNNYLD